MEAKCKKCEETFSANSIVVTHEGLFCEGCIPKGAIPLPFTFHFSWRGINAIMAYIDGDRDLDTLEIVETIRKAIPKRIIEQIRRVTDGEISESDS
jgi:hypothetical protein